MKTLRAKSIFIGYAVIVILLLLLLSYFYNYNHYKKGSFFSEIKDWNTYTNGWDDFVVSYPKTMKFGPGGNFDELTWEIGDCQLQVSDKGIVPTSPEDLTSSEVTYNGIIWNITEYTISKGSWAQYSWKYWETRKGSLYISFSPARSGGYKDCEKIVPNFKFADVHNVADPQVQEDIQVKKIAEEYVKNNYPQAELIGGKSYFDPLWTPKQGYERQAFATVTNGRTIWFGKKNGAWSVQFL